MTTAAAAPSRTNSLLWGSLVSGAYGSAATALMFLLLDGIQGQPLATASMLGGVVLLGADPSAAAFRLDMVALYSLVHLLAFVGIGAAATTAYQAWPWARSTPVLLSGLTAALTAGFLLVNSLLYPGLLEVVGMPGLLAGNVAAATAMTWVLRSGLAAPTPTGAGS